MSGTLDYPEDRLRAARAAAAVLRNDNDLQRRQIAALEATIGRLGEELIKAHEEIARLRANET